jgi:hypothetical protein
MKLRITSVVQLHLLKFSLTVFPRERTLLDGREQALANQGFESPYLHISISLGRGHRLRHSRRRLAGVEELDDLFNPFAPAAFEEQ